MGYKESVEGQGRPYIGDIPCVVKSAIIDFAHNLMYTGLRFKSTYIRKKGMKSHVWEFSHVFRDDLGNIKGTKMVHGV